MVRSDDCLKKYGPPAKSNPFMVLWDVPADLEIGVIPKRIYCNRDLILPMQAAFINLISRGYAERELLTWDGCFNIRQMTGGTSMSLHSWGIAVDVNAFNNGYGTAGYMTKGFVECFTDAGFDWGGKWRTPDPMHWQLKTI
jgi:hypothetical protein